MKTGSLSFVLAVAALACAAPSATPSMTPERPQSAAPAVCVEAPVEPPPCAVELSDARSTSR